MTELEKQWQSAKTFFESEECRKEVTREFESLAEQIIELAPAICEKNITAVSESIGTSSWGSSLFRHYICFVKEAQETEFDSIPSSIETGQLYILQQTADGEFTLSKPLLELPQQEGRDAFFKTVFALQELRKSISEMNAGEFTRGQSKPKKRRSRLRPE